MADPVFFPSPAPLTVAEIAAFTGARPAPGADHGRQFAGIAGLDRAGPTEVSYCESPRFREALAKTKAGACFCLAKHVELVPAGTTALVIATPHLAFALLGARLYPAAIRPEPVSGRRGISSAAHVDAEARLEEDVTVEPGALVGPGAEIGRGSLIGPGAVIGPNVRIGREVSIGAGASILHALVGNRVLIHPGARIGQDGFGFVPGPQGLTKIAQIGRVIIQDNVEIGANTTIDRGAGGDTIIGEGTKIDNLVQIGHNCVIGRHCVIISQVGISGSVTIGDFVMLAGQAGIRDHLTIGQGARIAGQAGVISDVPPGEDWVGFPAQTMLAWRRELRAIRRLVRAGGKKEPAEGDEKDGNERQRDRA